MNSEDSGPFDGVFFTKLDNGPTLRFQKPANSQVYPRTDRIQPVEMNSHSWSIAKRHIANKQIQVGEKPRKGQAYR